MNEKFTAEEMRILKCKGWVIEAGDTEANVGGRVNTKMLKATGASGRTSRMQRSSTSKISTITRTDTMNLIYIYDFKYNKLGEFHSANGYGLKCICCTATIDAIALPTGLEPIAEKHKRVIVKRMN